MPEWWEHKHEGQPLHEGSMVTLLAKWLADPTAIRFGYWSDGELFFRDGAFEQFVDRQERALCAPARQELIHRLAGVTCRIIGMIGRGAPGGGAGAGDAAGDGGAEF